MRKLDNGMEGNNVEFIIELIITVGDRNASVGHKIQVYPVYKLRQLEFVHQFPSAG